MYVCVPQCMNYVLDNLCCSNSKNLYLPMFLPILYVVFYPFSSMLKNVHVQNVYNVNKPVTTICMLFVDFFRFFCTRSPKTVGISFHQNRSDKPAKPVSLSEFCSVYRSDSNFLTF
jgi:hypothetical protein